jgi:hypothetical protein
METHHRHEPTDFIFAVLLEGGKVNVVWGGGVVRKTYMTIPRLCWMKKKSSRTF